MSATPSTTPVPVSGLSGVTAVAAGAAHSLALKADGTVWAWGDDVNGELGNGITSTVPISLPVQVNGLSGVVAIAAGQGHSLALKGDGTVWAWGYGGNGALGDNSLANSDVPVQASNLTGVTAIAAGGPHSLALKADGTVWAWGYGLNGELGNDTLQSSAVPVPVLGPGGSGALGGVVAIAGGEVQSLAVKGDGTVWAWGYGLNGELGNDATASSRVPVPVLYLPGMTAIAAGAAHGVALAQTGPVATTYGYDSLYRLTSVSAPSGTTGYAYDPIGNRLSESRGGTTNYAYDKADRILSEGSITVTVDANGNETARGPDTFQYDQANRLTLAVVGGITTTYTYDGDGKRVSQTTGITTTNYLYDVNASLPNVLADGTYTYVYGVGLAYAADGKDNLQVFHTDGLGSVRALTDNNGDVIQTYQTDPFGVPTAVQGTSAQPFGFTGQQMDSNSLLYLRARYYDPTAGRFLQHDDLAGSLSGPQSLDPYAYGDNNPVDESDPSGMKSKTLGLPVLVIDSSRMPIKALHIQFAQSVLGYPSTLTYDDSSKRRAQRRRKVCEAGYWPLECDEYPFASTYEGGTAAQSTSGRSASTFPISWREHRIEGGVIGSFVRDRHLQAGDQFIVVVRSSDSSPLPAPFPLPVPGVGPEPAPEPEMQAAPA